MRTLLAFALIQSVGFLVLKVLAGSSALRPMELWSLSFGTGAGILSLGMFYLASCRIALVPETIFFMTGALLAALIACQVFQTRQGKAGSTIRDRHRHFRVRQPLSLLEGAALTVLALATVLVFVDAWRQPLLAFDARAIWAFKAKVIYFEHGIFNEVFLDAERLHAKTRYPQLIPQAEAFVALVSGRFDERVIKLIFPGFYLSLVLLMGSELARGLGRSQAILATGLFASLPALTIYANGGAASGYADLPLSFYVTALCTALFRWLQSRSSESLVLATLFSALTLFTKTEGLALVLVIYLATSVAARTVWEQPFRGMWPLIVAVLGGLLCVTPWFFYQARLPIVDENFAQLLTSGEVIRGIHRWRYIAWSLGKEFFLKPHLWSLLGISAAVVFLRSPKNALRSRFSLFLWIPALYSVVLCVIFLVIPWPLEDLFPVVLTRLVMHVAPLLFLWLCFEVGRSGLLRKGQLEV